MCPSPIHQPGLILVEGPELCRGCSVAGGLKVGEAISSMNISVFERVCGKLLGLEGEKKGDAHVIHIFMLVVKKDSGL